MIWEVVTDVQVEDGKERVFIHTQRRKWVYFSFIPEILLESKKKVSH